MIFRTSGVLPTTIVLVSTAVVSILTSTVYGKIITVEEAEQEIMELDSGFQENEEAPMPDHTDTETALIHDPLTKDELSDVSKDIINEVFRDCDMMEAGGMYIAQQPSDSSHVQWYLYEDQIATLVNHQNTVESWAESVVPGVVPEGSTVNDALKSAYLYIIRNYPYDTEILKNADRQVQYSTQGAYYAITTRTGICASLAKLFRAMVEKIPFDPATATVSYRLKNPKYLQVAIVEDETALHEWDAIKLNGTWYFYDCAVNKESLEMYQMSAADLYRRPEYYGSPQTNEWSY